MESQRSGFSEFPVLGSFLWWKEWKQDGGATKQKTDGSAKRWKGFFGLITFFFFLVSKTLNKHGSGFARVPDLVLLTELERWGTKLHFEVVMSYLTFTLIDQIRTMNRKLKLTWSYFYIKKNFCYKHLPLKVPNVEFDVSVPVDISTLGFWHLSTDKYSLSQFWC